MRTGVESLRNSRKCKVGMTGPEGRNGGSPEQAEQHVCQCDGESASVNRTDDGRKMIPCINTRILPHILMCTETCTLHMQIDNTRTHQAGGGGVNVDTCPGMWLQKDWMTHKPLFICYMPHPATPIARTSCPASHDAPVS